MLRRKAISLVCCLAAALSIGASVAPAQADGTALAVVVSKSSPVSGLSFHELKQLYRGNRLKDPSGKWMVPLNRKGKVPERVGFDDSVLGMSQDVAGAYWIDRKIRGQSGAPKAIKSGALIVRLVAKVPGAIGYVKAGEAKGVKIVKIDGKLPGQPGYAVHF